LKVVLAQLAPVPAHPAANAELLVNVLRNHRDADLAVFPELFLSGYTFSDLEQLARLCKPEIERVAQAAAECRTAVLVGYPQLAGGGVANALACINEEGALVGTYRKTHLFGEERKAFVAGDSQSLVFLAGRRIGVLICFDVEFPEPARALTVAGAEILVTAAANMAPFQFEHDLLTRCRALENRRPLIYVNRVGSESGFRFIGQSRVVGADGREIVRLGSESVEVAQCSIPDAIEPDERLDYVKWMRPGLEVIISDRASTEKGFGNPPRLVPPPSK